MPLMKLAPIYYCDRVIVTRCPGKVAVEPRIEFGRYSVLPRQRQLLAGGTAVELGARAFEILLALVEADGSLVTKDELFNRVWPGRMVQENNLHTQISALRRALSDDRDLIRTEFGRGYRLTAAVRPIAAPNPGVRITHQRHRRAGQIPHVWVQNDHG